MISGSIGCTVVEQTPLDPESVCSSLAEFWAFVSFYPLSEVSLNRSLLEVNISIQQIIGQLRSLVQCKINLNLAYIEIVMN